MTRYSLDKLKDISRGWVRTIRQAWARSQHEEGINQLHRFLFLRQAGKYVYWRERRFWIDRQIAHFHRRPDEPYAGVGGGRSRGLLALSADRRDLVDLVRGTQAEALFSFSLSPERSETLDDEVEEVRGNGMGAGGS